MKKDLEHIKQHGFKTPDDYFESFDDKLFNALSQDDLRDNKLRCI